jgi:hypothetical protein
MDNDAAVVEAIESYSLSFNPLQIRVWGLLPLNGNDVIGWRQLLPDEHFVLQMNAARTFHVEGIGTGSGAIQATWHGGQPYSQSRVFDTVTYTVWDIDVDIDSDNSDFFPDHSAWEEELEDHDYAIGKFVFSDSELFVPFTIDIPVSVMDRPWTENMVRFTFNPFGESGIIKIWRKPAHHARIPGSINDGGDQVFPGELYPFLYFQAPDHSFDALWIEEIDTFAGHAKKKGVDDGGKPDDRIRVSVISSGVEVASDEIKYMNVDPLTFYPTLNAREEVQNSMAASGVYGLEGTPATADMPQFALRILSNDELIDLGVPESAARLIGLPAEVPGLKSGVYRNYITGKYVLAFAGTDFESLDDWINNALQGLNADAPQYNAAMEIADGLVRSPAMNSNDELTITGHSLGGGLASAASMVAGIHADTFNAAGLNRETLEDVAEFYVNVLPNFDNNRDTLVDAYFVDWDILSWLQDNAFGLMTSAIGERHELDGPVDLEVALNGLATVIGTNPLLWKVTLGTLFYEMALCHKMHYVHYGLLFNESTGWDAFGYEL